MTAHGDGVDTSSGRVHETGGREHVCMEHAIEKVARVIDPDGWKLHDKGTFPPEHPAAQAVVRRSMDTAHALASAGLLAPAPLREEWSTTNEWGDEDYCCGFDARETVEGDGRPIVRRLVSDWLPVDRAEGDGKAEQ